MNPQEQAFSKPTAQPVKPEAKKCNHMIIIVILAILAVGGFVFGGIELWQNMKKNSEVVDVSDQREGIDIQDYDGSSVYTNTSGDNSSGSIEITIKADIGHVELNGCESETSCLDASGYAPIIIGGDELWAYPKADCAVFWRSGGVFSGASVSQDNIKREFEFDGEIKQIMVGEFGNGGNEAILVLRKNGTLGAVRLNDEYKDFIDIQIVEGVSDVDVLYPGYNHNGSEVFAMHSDGSVDALGEKIWKK